MKERLEPGDRVRVIGSWASVFGNDVVHEVKREHDTTMFGPIGKFVVRCAGHTISRQHLAQTDDPVTCLSCLTDTRWDLRAEDRWT